jgi:FMN reductase
MLVGAASSPGRFAAAIAVAAEVARSDRAEVEILNLAETRIDICDGRALDSYGETTCQAIARIAAASAVLIGAPVYRASYPGVLKNLLDIVPVEILQNKPVGIIAMGGLPHHYLAVDSQLRQVLAWFSALVAPTSVYVTGSDFRDGKLASEPARKGSIGIDQHADHAGPPARSGLPRADATRRKIYLTPPIS